MVGSLRQTSQLELFEHDKSLKAIADGSVTLRGKMAPPLSLNDDTKLDLLIQQAEQLLSSLRSEKRLRSHGPAQVVDVDQQFGEDLAKQLGVPQQSYSSGYNNTIGEGSQDREGRDKLEQIEIDDDDEVIHEPSYQMELDDDNDGFVHESFYPMELDDFDEGEYDPSEHMEVDHSDGDDHENDNTEAPISMTKSAIPFVADREPRQRGQHNSAPVEPFSHHLPSDLPTVSQSPRSGHSYDCQEVHLVPELAPRLQDQWTSVAQESLPDTWKWDVEYQNGCWTCVPLYSDVVTHYPLTIGGAPLVLPVQYRWPPIGGVAPPPDPRPSRPVNCREAIDLEVIRDLFLTFKGCLGFYVLINGLLQVIVPDDFDTSWASSHMPQRFGGLRVCYIAQDQESTMLPSASKTARKSVRVSAPSASSKAYKRFNAANASSSSTLRLNDFIEARPTKSHGTDRYAGRIGLKVARQGDPFLIMSTHVITEALLAKSHRNMFTSRGKDSFEKLRGDWNEHVDIWAGNERMGTVHHPFDLKDELGHYPKGFQHDITLISPTTLHSVKDIKSPISGMGWLNREAWNALRHNSSAMKFLSTDQDHRKVKTLQCRGPSEIAVIGEGIFLNKNASLGGRKGWQDHDLMTWEKLVSRAVLYRVCPDLDPPNGYSGTALYAEGMRSDGTVGPGIVGFQSFVQRSGQPQNFAIEGKALGERLKRGLVAFYGAFQVPDELQREFVVV